MFLSWKSLSIYSQAKKKCMEDHGNIIKHFNSPFCFSQKDTKNEYQSDG